MDQADAERLTRLVNALPALLDCAEALTKVAAADENNPEGVYYEGSDGEGRNWINMDAVQIAGNALHALAQAVEQSDGET